MTGFVLDVNLSPLTTAHLRTTFGYDVVDLITLRLSTLTDPEIVAFAQRQQRVIITFDLDFGDLYYRQGRGTFGVIVLRLTNQSVLEVNRVLDRFFRTEAVGVSLANSLVVLDEERTRVVGPS